jgi:cytochrome b561
MHWRNTQERYGAVAKTLHWLMAIGILGMVLMGLSFDALPGGQRAWMGLHKSLGITILGLALLRLLWRFANPVPKLPPDMRWWEKAGAHASHYALYGLMIGMPLLGWAMSSAAGYPSLVWGVEIPPLVERDKALRELTNWLHLLGGWAILVVAAVHASAALYHHFVRKDDVLKRMLPGGETA